MVNRIIEKLVVTYGWICCIILVGAVVSITGFLVIKGASAINMSLIFGDTDPVDALLFRKQVFGGLFPAITGTISLVILSVSLAVPVGVAAGIYMAEYGNRIIKQFFSVIFDILAGIPSIVIGLFGFSVAIFLHKYFYERIYPCLLISGISLAFLVLPYIVRTTQVSLESISEEIRLTAPALGATKLQNIIYVLIPRSLSGIVSGVVLAIGRCAEDTAVIMLTGVVATTGVPESLLSSYEALPFYIYYISSQYSDKNELMTGYGAAIILLIVCSLFFFTAFIIKRRLSNQALYRF